MACHHQHHRDDESIVGRRADALGGSYFRVFDKLSSRSNEQCHHNKHNVINTMRVLAIAALFSLAITCSAGIAFDSRPVFAVRG